MPEQAGHGFALPLIMRCCSPPHSPSECGGGVPAFAIIVGVMVGMLRTLPTAYAGRRTFRHFTVLVAGLLVLHFVAPWSATACDGYRRLAGAPAGIVSTVATST